MVLFRLVRPEQLARPEGFRSLVDFITVLRGADLAVAAERVGAARGDGVADRRLRSAAALPALVDGRGVRRARRAAAPRALRRGFSKAQESAQRWARKGSTTPDPCAGCSRPFGVLRASSCSRNCGSSSATRRSGRSSSCSAVLVVVYVFNIKLPAAHAATGMTFFLVNVVPFLNLVLAGFVLASIAARFIFPAREPRGTHAVAAALEPDVDARPAVGEVLGRARCRCSCSRSASSASPTRCCRSARSCSSCRIGTITLMTFAIAGLAIGFGTMFPQFETENAAQIPTSFGGLLFMMTSRRASSAAIVVLEARPVYTWLGARAAGESVPAGDLVLGLAAAAMVCLLATFIPLRIAQRRLETIER